jgi:hypothetical protein
MSIQNIIEAAKQWRLPQWLREEVLAEIEPGTRFSNTR